MRKNRVVSCTQSYDALGLPATRTAEDGTVTTVTGDYDYMGRRIFKKVETTVADPETGESTTSVILNHRYLYRGHLQIAALDLTRTTLNALWYILWDPTEPVATRPLAIQTAGSWFAYGWDLTKNVMELYKSNGTIANSYSYAPFGEVTQRGNITNPLQWSSEMFDGELGLVYYNYRHYTPHDGRWISRDPIAEQEELNLYAFVRNNPATAYDRWGNTGIYPSDLVFIKQGTEESLKAIQKLLEGYKALKEANIIGADKWFHCLYMCKATRESKSPNLVLSLGVLREIVDLLKGRFKGAVDSKTGKKLEEIEHALDSLEDMKANRKGIDCPPEKTCECCCNEYKVNGL